MLQGHCTNSNVTYHMSAITATVTVLLEYTGRLTTLLKQHVVLLSVDFHCGIKCISINDRASLVTDCAACGEGYTRRAAAASSTTRPATSSASHYRKPAASFSWVTLINIIIIVMGITVTLVVVVVIVLVVVVVVNNCVLGEQKLCALPSICTMQLHAFYTLQQCKCILAMSQMSVSLSVCQTRALWQSKRNLCPHSCTT